MEAEPATAIDRAIDTTEDSRKRPPHVVALSVVMVAVWTTGGFALLLALTAFGLQCDESCVSPPRAGTEWYQRPDAGEWTEQLVLASLGALGIAAATFFIMTRKRLVMGFLSLAVAAVCYAIWAMELSESFWL
jgi:hypothetical protein